MFAHIQLDEVIEQPVQYQDIFDQRANSYHFAMSNWPLARQQEFDALLNFTDMASNQVVLDYPAGGGYLSGYVPTDIQLTHLESCELFARYCQSYSAFPTKLCKQGTLPQNNNSVDWVLSLAGLHHEQNKRELFIEMARVLKKRGQLVIADASKGSKTARFLDEWVGQYNPQGHTGEYFTNHTLTELENAGFELNTMREQHYHWVFDSKTQAAQYCQQLFGITLASTKMVRAALEKYLGFDELPNGVGLKWQLQFIHCQKR